MYWRWLGLALLLTSLITGSIIVVDVKTFGRVESFVRLEDGTLLVDRVIDVPPWNSTEEGWVSFTAILSHKQEVRYEAYGVIVPSDGDPEPWMVMRVVNETGLSDLVFDFFEEFVWNRTKVYAWAYLDENQQHYYFELEGIDESDKYIFLFRGLKEEDRSRPILISVKEAWSEEKTLLEPTMPNLLIVVGVGVVGLYLVTTKPESSRKRLLKKAK